MQKRRGIDATAGPDAEWNIADQLVANRGAQQAIQFLYGRAFANRCIRREPKFPIRLNGSEPIAPFQKVPGRKFFDPRN